MSGATRPALTLPPVPARPAAVPLPEGVVLVAAWSGSTRASRLPRDWPRIRARILRRDPTCCVCWLVPSAQVDHIRPGDDHSDANLRGICAACHASKSGREGGRASAAQREPTHRPTEPHPGLIER
ncbi:MULTISPECIES: HNH endonuclease signature motif containing protein [unclassified Crossiella]|uniref:HNH endonuclease signature motif containing protein n=1 Tax=unclassified Crossiella TaxID=2620835 RepID=UPI001FFE5658|nr:MULTISPECIES: HNH endonuclease signature motif containing protein [unclassified Crossiella]MCK2239386.1 HNH endonuclease [Crossiella sp. S99.2]MCK2252081.1 HNH endonuclease [Crossiella sp. S99.1]